MTPQATDDPVPGRILDDRHRLERIIASGGMATVWEATDLDLTRRVAVKILHPRLRRTPTLVERFRREARIGARLNHQNIVTVLDAFRDGPTEAFVMEFVRGTSLRHRLDRDGPLPVPFAAAIGLQIAEALHHAHRSGLVHRDVKPGNILATPDRRVLLADFGIASPVELADPIRTASFVGTPKYLAPEQVAGGIVDGRADLYALGVVLHEIVTGRAPFTGTDDLTLAHARLHHEPPRLRDHRSDAPESLERIVGRLLARDPDDRPVDPDSLREPLLDLIGP